MLREYAELLGLTGGDQFRVRNYEKAAKAVAGYPDDLGALPEAALTKFPASASRSRRRSPSTGGPGPIKAVDELRAKVPPGALLLAKVPGVGPKRALQLAASWASPASPTLTRRCGAAGCAGWPGSAPRARSASCAASPSQPATSRCAKPCARCRPTPTEDEIDAVLAAHVATPEMTAAESARNADSFGRRPPRRPAHPHRPDRRDRLAGGMIAAAEARGYEYYAVTDHAPNLVMQRMTDEKMLAQRAELRALADTDGHGPAARHRAEHRGRRQRGLGRGFPERVRHLRRIDSLVL